MIRALGYSHTEFDPASPGRLCRGRERWIEPWDQDDALGAVHRLVISGASFTDDSASDADRGLHHSGVDPAQVIAALFPRKKLLAFMEDGHPADIPEGATDIEMYSGHRAGGRSEALLVRWFQWVQGIREIRTITGANLLDLGVRGFALLEGDEEDSVDEATRDALFLLLGMSNLDSPPAQFQPAALHAVLGHAKAIVLYHRDKNGPAIGVYSREPIRTEGRLEALCDKHGSLLVRFAIPPMLARWDRALAELRTEWMSTREDEFPVPPAPEQSRWEPRRRSRKDKRDQLAEEAARIEAMPADVFLEEAEQPAVEEPSFEAEPISSEE